MELTIVHPSPSSPNYFVANFINFLSHLCIPTVPTAMTFSVSRDKGRFEWAGTSLRSIFAQALNLISPRMWRLLYDVFRFNVYALDLLRDSEESEQDPAGGSAAHANGSTGNTGEVKGENVPRRPISTPKRLQSIGEYCDQNGYSRAFKDDYLIPLTAAVWSTPPSKCTLEFPALTLARFMYNHHLLSTFARRPDWMTIPGGSVQYIDAVVSNFPSERLHLRTPIVGIEDINSKIILQFENDEEDLFDHVVLAVHGDQAHAIIADSGTEDERDILSNFQTTENVAYLHNDTSLMPRRKATWSSWNLLTSTAHGGAASTDPKVVSLTYNMNILQHISQEQYGDVLVSLNPPTPPRSETVQGKWIYHHPLYNAAAVRAQKALPRIQNTRGISYVGAWTKYGFHEDGFSSGVAAAVEHLGAEIPFEFVDSTFARGRRPVLTLGDWLLRVIVWWIGIGVGILDALWYSVEPAWWVVIWAWGILTRIFSILGIAKGNKTDFKKS